MSRLRDNSFVKTMSVRVRFTAEEYERLEQHRIRVRAPNMAGFAREIILRSLNAVPIQCLDSASIVPDCKDNKESNKEKKENSIPPEKNAPARPRGFDVYFSQITDDESLRGMVEEFLNGELRKGVDLARKTDLREHFYNWLPKYRNKLEMKAKQHTQAIVQNEAKAARESDSDALQRKCDADIYAANLPEALAEKERVLAKFGKPWTRKETNRKL